MVIEIIDLTNSHPSPPRSSDGTRILNFGAISIEKSQNEKVPLSLRAYAKPNSHPTNQQQATLWPISGHTYQPSQIITGFQPGMHGERVATVPESNTHLFPHGVRLKDPWTHKEQELYLTRLNKCEKGQWSRISSDYLENKTPQQVQRYAASFYRHQPSTYLRNLMRGKTTYSAINNPMGVSSLYSMSMTVNKPQQTLMLFPEKAHSFPIPRYGEASSNTNPIMYGFQQPQKGGASTSVTASANGEVDLELRLGPCQ